MISHLRSGACNDAEKAKLIYLTHHLGVGDARLFINNEITEKRARVLLEAQIGVGSAAAKAELRGNYIRAHRNWLSGYINDMINLLTFYCKELTNPPKQGDILLDDVLSKI